ncbi:hypothetical protein HYE82_21640 [Streptomyces sp. BR123]|uniref:hypothetical protein n=1 Tax=Streptomyces sp. BR123 TaxID=2749828 RepID=UPI0015C41FE9|nr:hypothetical protein [Streptomyces sp. BR123]NXY96937.1 hypothetical protein [Streptomyces sp. BR123]
MFERIRARRIVLAGACVALVGGGIALPATAMAAPVAAPQQVVSVLQDDSADGIGTSGDATAGNTTVGGEAKSGTANSGVADCDGGCDIRTGNARSGDAGADAVNTGDATAVTGDATGTGGTVSKQELVKQELKQNLKDLLKAKIGK